MHCALKALLRFLVLPHVVLSLAGVAAVTLVLAERVVDRSTFASNGIKSDVMERWGAPIEQPAPSVRYVQSGTVFANLRALPLDRQRVTVEATMSYRRRGLVFFSGFDFALAGSFEAHNPEATDIDVAFVFPIKMRRNQVLLSDLEFAVDGKPAPVELSEESDKLVWTGRATPGQKLAFDIRYRGRGLDSFVWQLDPAMRVNDFRMDFRFRGGSNFDYPAEVVPASTIEPSADGAALTWSFPSLESGVPVGLVLPSQQSHDRLIATASQRAWAFFLLLFAGAHLLFARCNEKPGLLEAGLIAASYAIVFPLLGYLAAVLPFALAAVLALAIGGALLILVAALFLSREAAKWMAGLAVLSLILPLLAVVLEGFTGLLYTLEVTAILAALVMLVPRAGFRALIDRALLQGDPSPTPSIETPPDAKTVTIR